MSLCRSHLSVVDVDTFPPLLVVGGLAREQGDETVSSGSMGWASIEAILHNVQGEI